MKVGRTTYNYGKVHECIQVVSNLPLDTYSGGQETNTIYRLPSCELV